jgi:hypothetical protein
VALLPRIPPTVAMSTTATDDEPRAVLELEVAVVAMLVKVALKKHMMAADEEGQRKRENVQQYNK